MLLDITFIAFIETLADHILKYTVVCMLDHKLIWSYTFDPFTPLYLPLPPDDPLWVAHARCDDNNDNSVVMLIFPCVTIYLMLPVMDWKYEGASGLNFGLASIFWIIFHQKEIICSYR